MKRCHTAVVHNRRAYPLISRATDGGNSMIAVPVGPTDSHVTLTPSPTCGARGDGSRTGSVSISPSSPSPTTTPSPTAAGTAAVATVIGSVQVSAAIRLVSNSSSAHVAIVSRANRSSTSVVTAEHWALTAPECSRLRDNNKLCSTVFRYLNNTTNDGCISGSAILSAACEHTKNRHNSSENTTHGSFLAIGSMISK